MDIAIIFVSAIIGLVAIVVFSLAAFLVLRRRKYDDRDLRLADLAVDELDAALDSAIKEINRLGALINEEVDGKYKSILFLYKLMEERARQAHTSPEPAASPPPIASVAPSAPVSPPPPRRMESPPPVRKVEPPVRKPEPPAPKVETPPVPAVVPAIKKPTRFSSPKHKQIWTLHEDGATISDIAKEFGIGQGEVKLILEIATR